MAKLSFNFLAISSVLVLALAWTSFGDPLVKSPSSHFFKGPGPGLFENIGDPCEHTNQCPGNASCVEERPELYLCRCNFGFAASDDNTRCLPVKPIGDPCDSEEDRCPNNAICDQICLCIPPKVPSEDRSACLDPKDIGDICFDNGQCPFNSTCSEGENGEERCTCHEGFVPSRDNKRCLPIRERLEEDCEEEQQCAVGNSTCNAEEDACLCREGLVGSGDKSKCLPEREVGEPCEEAVQCPENSDCTGGACRCRAGFVEVGGKCLPERDLGEGCEADEQCPQNSNCTVGICKCAPGFVEVDGKCLPERDLGEGCEANEQCPENSECSGGACRCRAGFVEVGGRCLPERDLGESCEEHEQCPQNSNCTVGICRCAPGFVEVDGKCLPERDLGEGCEANEQCPENGQCMGGLCVCREGFIDVGGKCLPRRDEGEECEANEQCPPNSDCEGNICRCRPGFIPDGGRCVPIPTTTTEGGSTRPWNLCPEDDDMEPPGTCPPHEDDPTYFPYPYDCRKYFQCSNGAAICMRCANATVWGQEERVCVNDFENPCVIVTTTTPRYLRVQEENSIVRFFKKFF